jgi:hypothetical protein
MNEKVEFHYERTDAQLIAFSSLPILERLHWLDEVRQFTLMMRAAPTFNLESRRWQDGESEL